MTIYAKKGEVITCPNAHAVGHFNTDVYSYNIVTPESITWYSNAVVSDIDTLIPDCKCNTCGEPYIAASGVFYFNGYPRIIYTHKKVH